MDINITVTEIIAESTISETVITCDVVITNAPNQQQSDWNQTDNLAVDYIKNKPTIPNEGVQSVTSTDNHIVVDNTDPKNPLLSFQLLDNENLLTDDELSNLNNQSGTNTGDQDLSGLATKLEIQSKADLVNGLVPSSQLPSYVDDVIDVANFAALPITGESGKIYITQDDNLTYRWSGTCYAEISKSLALGETSATAYRGDRGKIAYDHSQITGNPHGTSKSDVGLGNVDNTSDAEKPISLAVSSALSSKSPTTHNHEIGNLTNVDLTETTPLATDSILIEQTTTGKVKKSLFSTVIDLLSNTFVKKSDVGDIAFSEMEALYSYGVLIDNRFSSPIVTRIGNLELHKTLPVQSNMRGCLLLDDGTVNYYLNPTNWSQKADLSASVLDGTDGQVMVEIPAYYVKYKTIDQFQIEVRISTQPLSGYTLKPKRYISAYKAALQRSNSKLSSVINLTTDFRGGNNNAAWDAAANSFLGKPVSEVNLTNFRTYARNRGNGTRWNCMTYDLRKSMYWLFVIEYANLNSQAAVTAKDAITGYMQGGLGNGVTTANGTEWSKFNNYRPFIPCGVTNSLGNASGEVSYVATDFSGDGVNRTFTTNRYRGIENPFGDIWEWTDGILIDVKTDASGGTSTLYTSSDPAQFTSSVLANYTQRGLLARTDGYIKQILFGTDGDVLPVNVYGASPTTYYCDNFWRDINSNAIRGVVFGGSANDGSQAGLVYAATPNAPSSASTTIGSRLCFV